MLILRNYMLIRKGVCELKPILIMFATVVLFGSLFYFAISMFRLMLFKHRHDSKLYMISSYITLFSGLNCLIIGLGSFYVLLSSKDMTYIIYCAMVTPLFTDPLLSSLIVIKDDSLLYKNNQHSISDLVIVEKGKTILGHKVILENSNTNKKIVLFLSKKGVNIIESKILKKYADCDKNNNYI